jgi:hypothetical protein
VVPAGSSAVAARRATNRPTHPAPDRGDHAMNRLAVAALVVALAGLAGVARAQDKSDPTGTWKWKVEFNGNEFEQTLKLKKEGDKLTGTLTGRNNQEMKIEDGKFKDGEVSFHVTRERDGMKFTIKYKGKLSDDTIKGKTEFNFGGETRDRDWEAKREKKG